jgi:rhodanese-related sulfurtransferase
MAKMSFLILFLMLVLPGCKRTDQLPITEFDQAGLETYSLVDVRTPEEFAAGHLENAVNINWYDEDFEKQVATLPKENTIYVYCQKGGRSAKAVAVLHALGYKAVDLTEGYGAITADPSD